MQAEDCASSMLVGTKRLVPLPPHINYTDIEICGGDPFASGGFGVIRKGIWQSKEVAIKLPKEMPKEVDNTLRDFRDEAVIFGLVEHKNIVKMFGACLDLPNIFLVMELARGGSLEKVLLSNAKIQQSVLINWAMQIAEGMEYLHNGKITILHRDLKSANVLILEVMTGEDDNMSNKTLKITDFGLSHEIFNTTFLKVGGTVPWMAPEVLKEGKYSKASDSWSFGVVLWELFMRTPPYDGMNHMCLWYKIAMNKLSLPILETCPKAWGALMKACWTLDPHQRPTFGAILKKLQNIFKASSLNSMENFDIIQQKWKYEIDRIFRMYELNEEKLTRLNKKLSTKIMLLDLKQQQHEMQEESLKCMLDDIAQREMDLAEEKLRLVNLGIKLKKKQEKLRQKEKASLSLGHPNHTENQSQEMEPQQ